MEATEFAVSEIRGRWRVLHCEVTVPGVAKGWSVVQTIDPGLGEAQARAWALWWTEAAAVGGFEAARAAFPAELAKSRRLILASMFAAAACVVCRAPLTDEARCDQCGAHQ